MKPVPSLSHLSDGDVINTAKRLAADERQTTAALIACLVEVDARRLFLAEGCSSLFAWCTEVLHFSGDAAYGRIEVARVARRYPVVLEALASGSVTMTAVALLRPHLTDANHRQLLADAHHRSKRDVEQLVAALAPKPDLPPSIRKLPASAPTPRSCPPPLSGADLELPVRPVPAPPPAQRSIVAPLAPERYRIQFTVDRATHDRLRRAQDLLRHAIPNGDPAMIFDRALTLLVAQLERQKTAAVARPRAAPLRPAKGRTIPAHVRRAVSRRDDGRCAFVGTHGRCTATAFLEFHHVVPYARGGTATVENIQLRCRAHNQYEAEGAFGTRAALFVREASSRYGRQQDAALFGPGYVDADFLPGTRVPLTYHRDPDRWTSTVDGCRLQSVAKGQEFVLDLEEYPGVRSWAEGLCAAAAAR